MHIRELRLPPSIPGKLFLSAMPGREEQLSEDLREIRDKAISTVARLVGDDEVARRSPEYSALIAERRAEWKEIRFPIEDFGLPDDIDAFEEAVDEAIDELSRGRNVLVHCNAGIGRTGTFAGALLIRLGIPLDTAIELVAEAGSHAETEGQMALLRRISKTQPRS